MSEVTIHIRAHKKERGQMMTPSPGGEVEIDVAIPVQRAEFERPAENTDEPLKPQRVYEAGIELRSWQRDQDTLTDLGAFSEGLVHEAAKAVGLEPTIPQADLDSLRTAAAGLIGDVETLRSRSSEHEGACRDLDVRVDFASRRLDIIGAPNSEEEVRTWEHARDAYSERGETPPAFPAKEAPAAFRDAEEEHPPTEPDPDDSEDILAEEVVDDEHAGDA